MNTQSRSRRYKLPQVRIHMVKEGKSLYSDCPFSSPSVVYEVLAKAMRGLDRETVVCVVLDTRLNPLNFTVVSVGGINMAYVQAANVFKTALLSNGASVILAHNHPSGVPEPSTEDIELTKKIVAAGKVMYIPVLDHIICGDGSYLSLKETHQSIFD